MRLAPEKSKRCCRNDDEETGAHPPLDERITAIKALLKGRGMAFVIRYDHLDARFPDVFTRDGTRA